MPRCICHESIEHFKRWNSNDSCKPYDITTSKSASNPSSSGPHDHREVTTPRSRKLEANDSSWSQRCACNIHQYTIFEHISTWLSIGSVFSTHSDLHQWWRKDQTDYIHLHIGTQIISINNPIWEHLVYQNYDCDWYILSLLSSPLHPTELPRLLRVLHEIRGSLQRVQPGDGSSGKKQNTSCYRTEWWRSRFCWCWMIWCLKRSQHSTI